MIQAVKSENYFCFDFALVGSSSFLHKLFISVCLCFTSVWRQQKKMISEIIRRLLGNKDLRGRFLGNIDCRGWKEANFSLLHLHLSSTLHQGFLLDYQIFLEISRREKKFFWLEIVEDFIVKRHACLPLTEKSNKPINRGRSDKEKSRFDKIAIQF